MVYVDPKSKKAPKKRKALDSKAVGEELQKDDDYDVEEDAERDGKGGDKKGKKRRKLQLNPIDLDNEVDGSPPGIPISPYNSLDITCYISSSFNIPISPTPNSNVIIRHSQYP
jgi:hypothetical protein